MKRVKQIFSFIVSEEVIKSTIVLILIFSFFTGLMILETIFN